MIACRGLAHKADVDDVRESPVLRIVETLAREGVREVLAVEPHIQEAPEGLARHDVRVVSLSEALERADLIVPLVPHRPFRNIPASQLQRKMVVDACGLLRFLT
ncbi:UDP binding domain-containing protein [Arhodomonas sp. SL1]|uniref:UDP binding domain-containing protein n=1 Tax=Arhodomonas sp. SL1 TaxID=3425691 RepID=UPI003F881F1F